MRVASTNSKVKKSIAKILLTIFVAFCALQTNKIQPTNSFFTNKKTVSNFSFSAGFWIPQLSMSVSPEEPDGKAPWYVTEPCVTLEASAVDDVTIWYEFANDGNPMAGGAVYDGECIELNHSTDFSAIAVNNANSEWKSNIVSKNFKVDIKAPSVGITSPSNNELSGEIEIRGTVQDENPDHYWLVIEDEDGDKIAGPGTVDENNSFTDEKFFKWDTTKIPDGKYVIKLEARDQAENKDPDQSPITSDPNIEGDSVDWKKVEVKNESAPTPPPAQPQDQAVSFGDVVINEVMWMGSTVDADDEWIELRNTTDHDIEIGKWKIENGKKSHADLMIPPNSTIAANGFFLIANFPENSANTALSVNPDFHSAGMSLANTENGDLVLKNEAEVVIDQAKGDSWPAGKNQTGANPLKKSMQRIEIPGNGLDENSWTTCLDEQCNSTKFWDNAGSNFGTPGTENLFNQP